jgi:hypothetical protein
MLRIRSGVAFDPTVSQRICCVTSAIEKGFQSRRWPAETATSDGLFFLASLTFSNCILWPKFFPETPWLAIPKPIRARRITRYLNSNRKILFEIKKGTKVRYWEISDSDTRRFKSSGIEHRVIMFDWASGSNNEIIAAFADWVRHSRPPQFPSPRDDASRENVNAALLTRLAVMRLLHTHAHRDAVEHAHRHGLRMPKYQGKASSTRRKVRSDIRRIFQAAAFRIVTGETLIPADEVPRCWNTLTEQRRMRA